MTLADYNNVEKSCLVPNFGTVVDRDDECPHLQCGKVPRKQSQNNSGVGESLLGSGAVRNLGLFSLRMKIMIIVSIFASLDKCRRIS